MNTLSAFYLQFINLLNVNQVEYLLVGGFAVNYYGYPRPTRDLDIWVASHPGNALKLVAVCQLFGNGFTGLTPEPFEHPNRIVRIKIPPVYIEIVDPIIGQKPTLLTTIVSDQSSQIEILTVQTGVVFEPCYQERLVATVNEVAINIINLQHLLAIKEAGHRPKDREDVKHLRKMIGSK